ncbi:hemerythrin domain-containing protein [Streptomyces phaeochromogenes]|uniref:hemerythrin domain-containing protein n=1 Tax=Streptomyces phaeochromogenes TaxID=1923 RepID=UPI002DDAF0E9|nr:hypothetical protein [Streptomyces phaeochromogenes]WRZ27680.1 hemerythrin domain-containing protein [Streptomyces phaeochromogenes]WSJ09813.1 hemerythrin domain-containing protein [Streptomyces phaeochromogenes]
MADRTDPPPQASTVEDALEQVGVLLMPLMNRRYLRELARYRLLLASGARVSSERATALVRWWDTLADAMAGHHRAMDEVFRAQLPHRDPEFDAVVASMSARYESLESSRSEAGRRLTGALRDGDSPTSAQFSVIRLHEEVSAVSSWEEREIVPRALRSFTAADWARVEAFVIATQAAQDRLDHVLPWLCAELPADRARRVFASFPASMTRSYHSAWLPAFERFAAQAWP